MADTVRKQILDAVSSAFSSTTSGVVYVTQTREPWWDWDVRKFPGICVVDADESKRRFSFMDAAALDMYSELRFRVIGYEFDKTNNMSSKRTELIKNIEVAIQASTSLNDLTLDIVPITVQSDEGLIDNFCIVNCEYLAKYIYNHATP